MPSLDPVLVHLLGYTSLLSGLLLVAALIGLPPALRHLPVDWFEREPAPVLSRLRARPLATGLRLIIGGALAAAGVAMLVLPGQGLLTLAVGLLVLDLPITRGVARRLAHLPRVGRALQALRVRGGAPPFVGLPGGDPPAPTAPGGPPG